MKVINWATFVQDHNPQVAGIKGELHYFFLFSKLVRYGMADLSSLSVLPFTGLKSGYFLLLVKLSSWFGTNHWLWIGWLLVCFANFNDSFSLLLMSVSMFSLRHASSYVLYLVPKMTANALSELSQYRWYFLGWDWNSILLKHILEHSSLVYKLY